MGARIALLLGRTIWIRDAGVWRHESLESGASPAPRTVERLADILSAATSGRTALVFEPEGLAHQIVETPKVSRRVFASLARVRSEHPVVSSENLGWGVEYPEPGPGGEFVTQLHSELTPGLIHLRDACERAGSRLAAAWSACTAAGACVSPRPSTRTRFVLILAPGYSAIAACGGKRSFRSWVGPMSDRDWKAFSVLLGDFDAHPSPSMADGELRRASMVVVAEGDPGTICPIWGDLRGSGRVEAVMDIEAFASNAARIPVSHPANLVEAFPRPLELDRYLGACAVAGLVAAVALGASGASGLRRSAAEDESGRAHVRLLQGRLDELGRNQREMERLRDEAPEAPRSTAGGHEALLGLALAVPDPLTLTSLILGRDGGFEIEAIVSGPDFKPEEARQAFARHGFAPNGGDGWAFDAATGKLLMRGYYRRPQP